MPDSMELETISSSLWPFGLPRLWYVEITSSLSPDINRESFIVSLLLDCLGRVDSVCVSFFATHCSGSGLARWAGNRTVGGGHCN